MIRWITQYREAISGKLYGTHVWADTEDDAKAICAMRKMGEQIIGMSAGENDKPVTEMDKVHEATFLSYVLIKSGTMSVDELLSDQGHLHQIIHHFTERQKEPEKECSYCGMPVEDRLHLLRSMTPGYLPKAKDLNDIAVMRLPQTM